jgi:hypothetical protein
MTIVGGIRGEASPRSTRREVLRRCDLWREALGDAVAALFRSLVWAATLTPLYVIWLLLIPTGAIQDFAFGDQTYYSLRDDLWRASKVLFLGISAFNVLLRCHRAVRGKNAFARAMDRDRYGRRLRLEVEASKD